MKSKANGGGRWQFSIRTALLAILIVALALGWYNSVVVAHRRNEELTLRLLCAQSEIQNAKSRAEFDQRPKNGLSGKGGLSNVCLDGMNLRGVSISSAVFQVSSFKNCDLRDATLTGGAASFQGAQFDNANLAGATLTGAGASFQFASFAGADLSGAVVAGNLQCASFEGAKLIGTRVIASSGAHFQEVNIDGAQFQGADLSTIDANSLETCYFKTPPLYDGKTKFPGGFDAKSEGWRLIE